MSAITGLQFKHDVPYALIDKNELHRYLEKRLRETMKPDDVRAEELTLKMLGLVPAGFRPAKEHSGFTYRTGRRVLRLQPEEAIRAGRRGRR